MTALAPMLNLRRRFGFSRFLLAGLALVAMSSERLQAADAEFVGVIALATEKPIADQLQLTDAQREKLASLVDRRETEVLEIALSLRTADAATREAKLGPFRAASEAEGLKLLDARQRGMLEQIRLRRAGAAALGEEKLAAGLKLSPEQQSARDTLLAERSAQLAKAVGAEREVVRVAFEQKLFGLLTPEQKKAWEAATGTALAQAAEATSAVAEKPQAGATTPAAQSSTADKNDPPKNAASKTATAATTPRPDAKLKFNFRFQPWGEVLDWFAEQAGLSLLMDAPPPGTLNYTDPRSYTPAEALDLMNGVLLTKGYTLVRRERMLIVVNLEDGVPPNLVSFVPAEQLDERGEFELLTTLFPIGNLEPEDVEKDLRRLIGPQGSVTALPKARQIQATETAGRLRMMRAVLRAATDIQTSSTGPIRAIEPVHISVGDALPLIRQLLNIAEDAFADPDGNVRLAIDPITGKLLVGGKPDRVNQVSEIMKAIDVPAPATSTAAVETPQLETYDVGAVDSATVTAVLQTMLAGTPDVRLTVEPQTGKLIALARPAQHATIRATLDQLQREGRQVDVIQLQRIEPSVAVAAIGKLFGAAGAGAPQVDADPVSRQLILRGNAGQLAQIRELLGKLGEQIGDGSGKPVDDTSTVRLLPLGTGSAKRALEQIEAVWPTLRPNRIRIVTPSADIESRYPASRESRSDASPSTPRTPSTPAPDTGVKPKGEAPGGSVTPPNGAPVKATSPEAKPTAPPATKEARSEEDDASPKPPIVRTISFLKQPPATTKPAAAAASPKPNTTKPNDVQTKTSAATGGAKGEPAPIVVSISPGGVLIASDDVAALNEFEALLNTLAAQAGAGGKEFTVFYLENASASSAAETLDAVFGSGGGGGGGSLMGDLASMALGNVGGGILGAMMGGGGGGGAAIMPSSSVLIVPDSRLNALIVQATPADLDLIEQLLRVVDRVDVPESTVNPRPRIIPVRNTSASQVADVVREVYQERLAGASRNRQPSPEEFMQMLRGSSGGSRGGSSGPSRQRQAEVQKISIGVDARTNSLIVSASEPVFQEIELLVQTLDQTTVESGQAIRVVTLKRSNAETVQKALSSIVGVEAKSNKKSSDGGGGGSGGGSSGDAANDKQAQEMMRQRIEMFNQMRGSGGFPGGGFPGGGDRGKR